MAMKDLEHPDSIAEGAEDYRFGAMDPLRGCSTSTVV
jgi:hypothetical protein